MPGKDSELLTIREVADYLKMGLLTVYKMVKVGKIPAFKIGKQWRVKKEDLEKYIETQKLEPKKPRTRHLPLGTEEIHRSILADKKEEQAAQ